MEEYAWRAYQDYQVAHHATVAYYVEMFVD
jgi:hypothetical protein